MPDLAVQSIRPADAAGVLDAVRWALAEEAPLEVVSGGTKRGLGRPTNLGHRLDLSGLAGILSYEPAELVMTVAPGTRLAEVEAAAAGAGQQLAFEPPDWGPLLGAPAGGQTIGGAVACNQSGPRRIRQGAARDHFLGFAAVSGRGEAFKAGGKVVKNVTGYDLCKLLAGSHGTLAVMTELTLKVLPAPEKTRTLLVLGLEPAAAVAAMGAAQNSPAEVSAAAHLSAGIAALSPVDVVRGAGGPVTAIRVEGPAPSVTARAAALTRLLSAHGPVEELHSSRSAAFWREVRDAAPFACPEGDPDGAPVLWRLSVPPAAGARVAGALAAALPSARWFLDWGGGLIWLEAAEAGAALVREAAAREGGHALLLRAPAAVRAEAGAFQAEPAALATLTARVKESFDPRRILNPGRMFPGI